MASEAIVRENCVYLGAIRNGREQSERSGGPNGAQDFFADLGQIHCSALGEQEEREQEENPRALDPSSSLAQIAVAIENERIPQHASKGKQIWLHRKLKTPRSSGGTRVS